MYQLEFLFSRFFPSMKYGFSHPSKNFPFWYTPHKFQWFKKVTSKKKKTNKQNNKKQGPSIFNFPYLPFQIFLPLHCPSFPGRSARILWWKMLGGTLPLPPPVTLVCFFVCFCLCCTVFCLPNAYKFLNMQFMINCITICLNMVFFAHHNQVLGVTIPLLPTLHDATDFILNILTIWVKLKRWCNFPCFEKGLWHHKSVFLSRN